MKRTFLIIGFISLICLLSYHWLMQDFEHTPSSIYYNGEIITLEDDQPQAAAVFVKNGVIQEIGNESTILSLKEENTELIDLDGKALLPGFIDSHTHLALSTFLYNMVDLSGFTHTTATDVWNHFEKAVADTPPDAWVICKGLDPILVEGLQPPTIQYLDQIAPDNPVIILSQSLHSYWANSKAFQLAAIDKDTPNPSASSYYEKDSIGALTGYIAEQEAFQPFAQQILEVFDAKTMTKTTQDVLTNYARNGNTTLVSTGLSINDAKPLRLYEHLSSGAPTLLNQLLSKAGILPDRTPMPRHFIYMRHDRPELLPTSPENGDDHYRYLGIKHWYDGSPYTGSMYMRQPYKISDLTTKGFHIHPGDRGKPLLEKKALVDFIEKYQKEGWQIAIHTQGDQAIDDVLEAYETVQPRADVRPFRHRLEHCLLLGKDAIRKMEQLNITPSFHINHLYYYGKALSNEILDAKVAAQMLPVRSAASRLPFSLHADQPMFESNPLHLMQTALLRKTKEGKLIGESEAISKLESLKAMTIHAAWQVKMENKLGSIKKGKYADFVILKQNPLETPTTDWHRINVVQTIVNGNPVKF